VTTVLAPTPVGLLASWTAHHRADLAAHLQSYGPLSLPAASDRAGAAGLAAELEASGLTGRGGAGFPSARKLAAVASAGSGATVVVNAMEGEPASEKDRVLLSVAPHLVLDGAEVMARLLGSPRIVVCVADDRDDTARRVAAAVAERRVALPAAPDVEVARPPARYAAGEESALVSWLDGGAGAPRFRPDKSVPLALGRRPVLVHNAETLAHVALVARYGAGWFRSRGSDGAPGTTLVTVSGAVGHPGVHEIPMGMPVAAVVALAGPTRPVQAVLVGGYGGAWLGAGDLDTPFAPTALARVGAGIGAGVLVVLGEGECGLGAAAAIARYMAGESAGQCGPCVFGLPALADDLEALAVGRGSIAATERLRSRFELVEGRGACRHPDGVVRMAGSALAVFATDVAAHAAGRPCPQAPVHRGARTLRRRPA
jgi:NADH:ubiquinone oxidoreductase subunit F (NADH-binding)